MDRDVVVIVKSDLEAYEAIKALSGLSLEGTIELYSSMIIKKENGVVTVVRDTSPHGPFGMLLGASLGGLIGLIGGPVGAATGAAVGGAAGLTTDVAFADIDGDFVRQVATRLTDGNYAVIASVWEDWSLPIDTATARFGGVVLRQTTAEIASAHIKAEVKALEEEQAHVMEEIKRSVGDKKARLEAQLDELQAKQEEREEKLRQKANALEARWSAHVSSIKERAASAKAEAKQRHEEHMTRLSRFAEQQRESFKQLFA